MKNVLRAALVVALPVFFLACPEKPPPAPPPVAKPPPTPVEAPPEEPPAPAEPPAAPAPPPVTLNEPVPDGGTVPDEAMPGLNKVEVGDYVVYDVETSRSDAINVFRVAGGQLTPVRARVRLIATAVDKTGVTVDVRYVPNGPQTTAPRWLESGLAVKMALGTPRPKLTGTETGLYQLPPKTPLKWVEHGGKRYRCRFARIEAATPEGTPSRRCVGAVEKELILGGGVVYAQNVKGADGNPLSVILVEAGRMAADKPGYQAFENGVPLVTRESAPGAERLTFFKLEAAGGQVKSEQTVHVRAATGQAAALTYDGANWLKPDVKKLNQEMVEWVAALFTDENLLGVLPEGGNPGASVVYGPTRIDTLSVGVEVPASGDQPARTFRYLVPARPVAIKSAPVWIRYGYVEHSVFEGEHVWKRRVVKFDK